MESRDVALARRALVVGSTGRRGDRNRGRRALMNRFAFPACTALAALLAFGSPARADFASCVAGLRADAAHAGISSATIDRAFSGLQPDMKVLDFQKQQPEFTTPIWDYVAGLVDEERVADGKAAMARNAARARPRRADLSASAGTWSPRSGGWSPISARRWASGRWCSRSRRWPAWASGRLFPLRADGDPEDRRPRRHSGREARRLLGGRLRPDPVHALELSEARGRRRPTGGATSSIRRTTPSPRPPIIS